MKLKSTLYIALTALTLAACGGGGGDGGGDSAVLSYSGSIREATLDSASAPTVSASLLANTGGAGAAATQTRAADTTLSVTAIVKRLTLSGKGYTRSNHVAPGSCGGSVTVSGDTSGSMVFDNYCVGDLATSAIQLNGTISFSATYAADGVTLQTFTMSYSGFTVTFLPENEVLAFGGSISITFDSSGVERGFTMTAVMQDNTGTMILFDNYTVTDDGTGLITVAGRFCHSTEGCVTVSTVQPLSYSGGGYPTGGVILITGAGSQARVTASATGYFLEVDADGDGAYEPSTFHPY